LVNKHRIQRPNPLTFSTRKDMKSINGLKRLKIIFLTKSWSSLKTSVVDPDPQEHGTGPKLTNKPGILPFKKAFVPSDVCFCLITYFKYIFWDFKI
jgi:hypothetical protein